jgi:hypothetical protein
LNGSEVPEREKLDSEIYHQRWTQKNAGGTEEQNNTKKFEPLFVVLSASNGKQSSKQLVSPNMQISLLKDLAFKETKIPPFRQKIFAKGEGMLKHVPLDQMEYSFEWYGFFSGVVNILIEDANDL